MWRIRNPHPRHVAASKRREREEKEKMAKPNLTKPETTHAKQPPLEQPLSPSFEASYPNLLAFMTQERWEDGTPRLTTTVLFFVERGELKLCISDRDLQRSAFLSGSDFQSLLELVEQRLEADDLDWRQKRLAR
jgi:hypothetical protein